MRNKRAFDQVLTFYLTNPSSLHSYTALKKAFGVTTDTAAAYTDALQDAFCVFEMQRYHPNLKVQARDPKKIYAIDPGLRNEGSRSAQDDTGKLLENLVYLELRRRQQTIHYYRDHQEVDFVLTDKYQPIGAIQVCANDMSDPDTYKREVTALHACLDALDLQQGTLITWTRQERLEEQGHHIELVPAYRWLIEMAP